ncbi:MAG TPA: DUF402 domain-containing protein [Anaerolineaceae bacterium]|nr:DUF402 domain-containing protein [Chloroflexota bacterium]HOU42758.1 DUF402 domain-containing protein [Anaerolineaceae bacterium]HQF45212.1 DUF402 domain-containing protein [Anaerolineaceae bacterium]HQH35059.1 DUF402 domain-containing protein [Anaerolineaceae bacterium]HQJ02374.1 DUF402 domain-containing protein [Anaerolineaceae bacterium]
MDDVIIIKQNEAGLEKWRYSGKTLQRTDNAILLEAHFTRPDLPFHEIVLANGDRFVEAYYADRWYNIFEIHSRVDDALKGWYCNVTLPARIDDGVISYMDLALDLLVYPDGRQFVLDEDEFLALHLTDWQVEGARKALAELQQVFRTPMPFLLINRWLSLKDGSGIQGHRLR